VIGRTNDAALNSRTNTHFQILEYFNHGQDDYNLGHNGYAHCRTSLIKREETGVGKWWSSRRSKTRKRATMAQCAGLRLFPRKQMSCLQRHVQISNIHSQKQTTPKYTAGRQTSRGLPFLVTRAARLISDQRLTTRFSATCALNPISRCHL
jgi:hypothetical protein